MAPPSVPGRGDAVPQTRPAAGRNTELCNAARVIQVQGD